MFDRTPLKWAVINRNKEMINLLIKNGADVTLKDQYGNTTLGCLIIVGLHI